jgi:hypothetical protein
MDAPFNVSGCLKRDTWAHHTACSEAVEFQEDYELCCAKATEYIFKVAGILGRESIFSFELQAADRGE